MATAVSTAKASQTLKTNMCKLIQTNVYLQNYTQLYSYTQTGDKKIHLSNKD